MSLRHTLLGILDWVPLHGYALRDIARGFAWLYPTKNANIYPTLRQLEDEGFIGCTEQVHGGRLRKVYTISDDGRQELRRWLRDPTGQRGMYRDPTLLKICLLRDGALAEARGWVEGARAAAAETASGTEVLLKDNGDSLPKYTRMVTEHGLALARLRAQWLAHVVDEIDEELGSGS